MSFIHSFNKYILKVYAVLETQALRRETQPLFLWIFIGSSGEIIIKHIHFHLKLSFRISPVYQILC